MSSYEQPTMIEAMKKALGALPVGPTLAAFGIAREDCALVHLDFFTFIGDAQLRLADAIAEAEGITPAEAWERYTRPTPPCDCKSCDGEHYEEARARHVASYTNVAQWHSSPLENDAHPERETWEAKDGQVADS